MYNHTNRRRGTPRGREMINVAVSEDGLNWQAALILDNGPRAEFSYPAVIQSRRRVHITCTWNEQLTHVTGSGTTGASQFS